MVPFRTTYQAIPQYEDPDDEPRRSSPPSKWRTLVSVTLVLIGTCALLAYSAVSSHVTSNTSSSSSLASSSSTVKLKVYDPNYGPLSSLDYLPWDNIAEPYRSNLVTLLAVDGHKAASLDTDSIVWEFDGEEVSSLSGRSKGLHTFDGTGIVSVRVSATTKKGVAVSGSTTIRVKYVRREIRTLTDDDRTDMLNAMHKVYKVSTEEGQALYGSKFKNIQDFVATHLLGAGTIECDHWHDGAGIMTHHVGFTLEFEQAMQAVNPAVSLGYWEYSRDAHLDDYSTSDIFQDSWFGELNPTNDDHTMSEGLWAYIAVQQDEKYLNYDKSLWGSSFNPLVNAYGQLRSPWNNNPSSYIGRHNSTHGANTFVIPGCSKFASCYESTTVADMNECLNGETHGPVHILIGGAWGKEDMLDGLPIETVSSWKGNTPLYFKVLWRMGITRCPSSCDQEDADANSCKCAIPDEMFEKFTSVELMKMSGLDEYFDGDLTEENARLLLEGVEDPGYVGEMYTSAAPHDPTFWPLHGAADRMLARKRIMASLGEIEFDESWGYGSSTAPYIAGYCDWTNVHATDELASCDWDITCSGHNEDDVLPFEDLLGEGTYTNKEFYDLIHPWNEDLPYVYDSYEFSYCTDMGFEFD